MATIYDALWASPIPWRDILALRAEVLALNWRRRITWSACFHRKTSPHALAGALTDYALPQQPVAAMGGSLGGWRRSAAHLFIDASGAAVRLSSPARLEDPGPLAG